MTGPKAEEVKKEINKLEDSKIALKGMRIRPGSTSTIRTTSANRCQRLLDVDSTDRLIYVFAEGREGNYIQMPSPLEN